jgi:hypothetical protein
MNEPEDHMRMKKSTRSLPARACPQSHCAATIDPFKKSQRLPLLSSLGARANNPHSIPPDAEFANFYRI